MFGVLSFSTFTFSGAGGDINFTGDTWIDKCIGIGNWDNVSKTYALQQKCKDGR